MISVSTFLVSTLVVSAFGAIILAALRVARGPTHADRIVAQDVLFSGAIVLCLAAALFTENTAFLDIALGLAVVGFIATIAWARLIRRTPTEEEEKSA